MLFGQKMTDLDAPDEFVEVYKVIKYIQAIVALVVASGYTYCK